MKESFKKVVLIILDGFGVASKSHGNAVTRARMPVFDDLVNRFPSISLQAAGPNVGLPWGEPGNSEVGHLCLGAGRVIMQDGPRVDLSIENGTFSKNEVWLRAFEHVKKHNSRLHLAGLIGEGGVHSSQLHLYALLNLAVEQGIKNLAVHAFTDGRDSSPQDSLRQVRDLERKMVELRLGKIATLIGRFYAMDRGLHWDLTEKAYRCMVLGEGQQAESALNALERNYANNVYDEIIPPTVVLDTNKKPIVIEKNDALIFFNFRPDRIVQLARAFAQPKAALFDHPPEHIENLYVASITEYARDLPVEVAYPKVPVKNPLATVLSQTGIKQYHIAEREKYAHITYFFDCGLEEPDRNETWEILKSSAQYLERYQNVPQMSAPELATKLCSVIDEGYGFYVVNFANPDMVGHTGNMEASIKALETIDACLKKISEKVLSRDDTAMFIVADHGNIETLIEEQTATINTSHTTNPVPFVFAAKGMQIKTVRKSGYVYLATQVPEGLLSDVAPTILQILGIKKPQEMTGISLMSIFDEQLPGFEPPLQHTGKEVSLRGSLER